MEARSDALEVAVVIICQDGDTSCLVEAIASVLMQTCPASEIVVIDDSGADGVQESVKMFSGQGVRYRRVVTGSTHENRRIGSDVTVSPVLCFLDARDRLSVDYLANGLALFRDPRVGVVYSDIVCFGARTDLLSVPVRYDYDLLQRLNYIHTGSLVRRSALVASGAWDQRVSNEATHLDWFMWRRVLGKTYQAIKQAAHYHRRCVSTSLLDRPGWLFFDVTLDEAAFSYFEAAALSREVITLFISLSGRIEQWPGLADFLEKQTWPHEQVQLILMDTSQSDEFHRLVQNWVAQSDYRDVRVLCYSVGAPGLADADRVSVTSDVSDSTTRDQIVRQVRAAVAKIYNQLAFLVGTSYCWIMEDDVSPAPDVCAQLLRSMGHNVAIVSAPYRSRYGAGFCVWTGKEAVKGNPHNIVKFSGSGVETVSGSGVGCAVIRCECLGLSPFSDAADFDRQLCAELSERGGTINHEGHLVGVGSQLVESKYVLPHVVKVDWDLECQHAGAPFYAPVARWESKEDWDQWRVIKDIEPYTFDKGLHLKTVNKDSQMSVKVSAPAGWLRFVIRCTPSVPTATYFYWKCVGEKGWSKKSPCESLSISKDDALTRTVSFFSDKDISEVRFDPHVGSVDMFIEFLALEALEGHCAGIPSQYRSAEYLQTITLQLKNTVDEATRANLKEQISAVKALLSIE